MDKYDDGYWTQPPYPQYRRVLVDGSGRMMSARDDSGLVAQPVRLIYRPSSHDQQTSDRPSTQAQVYRIGPRFNASVTRVDRRGSVDSGLSQVICLGGAAGPRVVRVGPGGYVNELQAPQAPQVVQLGPGSMRMVGGDAGTHQRVYRLVAGDQNTPPRSAMRPYPRTAVPLPFHQLQTSESGGSLPVSPDSVPRVVSYRIHPVRSEADFSRSGVVYSTECHAPVNQYQGGPTTCQSSSASSWTAAREDDDYDSRNSSGVLSRENSSETGGYGTVPGTDGHRALRFHVGGTSDHGRQDSHEGPDFFHQVGPPQHQPHRETSYHHINQPTTASNVTCAEADITPSFTVHAVGPVTDFGDLVCQSIRQFLLHKQLQKQQQAHQGQPAVPWPSRGSRDFVVHAAQPGPRATPPTTVQRQLSSSTTDQTPPSPGPAFRTPDDRNMFQRYNFRFDSIGNFGRATANRSDVSGDVSNAGTPTGTTATGSLGKQQVRFTGSDSTAPIVVFHFQDFDDMVARMREQNTPQSNAVNIGLPTGVQAPTDLHHHHPHPHHPQQQQQPQQQLLQRGWHGAPPDSGVDEETDDDSGYSTARSVDYQSRDVLAPVVTPANDARVPASHVGDSREELRRKISSFNNNSRGYIMSLEQNSDIFHGFIRVVMNLIRPVQLSLPTSSADVSVASRDEDSAAKVTTFHLPKDTTKVIHITSESTTREVIRMLLAKFHIQDNPIKFALYEQLEDDDQSSGGYMKRLADTDRPLPLCLRWADAGIDVLNRTRFVLQENDTGEIMWEAFSLPELESFLLILQKEEEMYVREIRQSYHVVTIQMQQRLKQLKRDRIGSGAKLKPVET